MVRNIDFPEALIFYDSWLSGASSVLLEDGDGNGGNTTPIIRAGLLDLLQECQDAEINTPVVLIRPAAKNANTDGGFTYSKDLLDKFRLVITEPAPTAPSSPKSLYEAIQGLTIQPAGFGGSSGFGRKLADPERSPMPAHVIVFCVDAAVCSAARYLGMRVLCLNNNDNDLADGVIDDYYNLYLEDVATPGSFWLNPPYPRDDEGDKVDPYYGDDDNDHDQAAEVVGETETESENESVVEDGEGGDTQESSMSEKDRLRAILDDMDRL